MSATTEAVMAMTTVVKKGLVHSLDNTLLTTLLDAIPADVMAQLAIEGGGLERVGYRKAPNGRTIWNGSSPVVDAMLAIHVEAAVSSPSGATDE